MKSVLFILIPVIILSIFLAGGFNSPFPKQEIFPSSIPDVKFSQASTIPGKQLQINPISLTYPSPQPSTPSAPNPNCTPGQKVAVDMLLDTSGSMRSGYPTRIFQLNNVVNGFVRDNLKNDDVIGIQRFSSDRAEIIPINTKLANIARFPIAMTANGYTYMDEGFILAKNSIENALPAYPDYRWVLIFLSDGVPETIDPTGTFDSIKPDPNQDPTNTANSLKSKVRIISIGFELETLRAYNGASLTSYARNLLQGVASSPSDYYDANTANLADIYNTIAGEITCN